MKRVLKKVSMLALIAASALAFSGCFGDDEDDNEQQSGEVSSSSGAQPGGSSSSLGANQGDCIIGGACAGSSSSEAAADGNTFIDIRDNKAYKVVTIGAQTWMAEDMRYETENSECSHDEPENCANGMVYLLSEAMEACPDGWHLPSDDEWVELIAFADGISDAGELYESSTAGKHLKAASGWFSGNGEDTWGFAALPEEIEGSYGVWWTSTKHKTYSSSYYVRRAYSSHDKLEWYFSGEDYKNKVRCIKD